jgi:hypothetical protein
VSDRVPEFVHCGDQPEHRFGVDGELVLAPAWVVEECVAPNDDVGRAVLLESAVGRSLALRPPRSQSTKVFSYCPVLGNAAGTSATITSAAALTLQGHAEQASRSTRLASSSTRKGHRQLGRRLLTRAISLMDTNQLSQLRTNTRHTRPPV